MTPQRWQRVKELFARCAAMPPHEREHLLDQACADDPDLNAELRSLLAASDAEDDFMTPPPPRVVASVLEHGSCEPDVGDVVGGYRLCRLLGRGGMGRVYLAQAVDPRSPDPTVAIKLVHHGPQAEMLIRRVFAEQHILARLRHPNIAALIGAGVTPSSVPYLIMEYVDGEPIDAFVRQRRCTPEQRLQVFSTICRAVHYAHQNLIIHRDLKPNNILVTAAGVPKLLDFGIAKLLSAGPEHAAPSIPQTTRLMTPEYASPEQLFGGSLTTATDIYSLGVILFELVTGRRPHRIDGPLRHEIAAAAQRHGADPDDTAWRKLQAAMFVRASPGKWNRVSGDEVKCSPAESSSSTASAATDEAAAAANLAHLQCLRGDLANIVAMALRHEPQRRYASAEQFAADVERYLRGWPVIARKDTLLYRARRFVRRHKAVTALATALVLSLAGGICATLWQARFAVRAERAAAEARARAERINQFLQGILTAADLSSPDPARTVRELLDAAALRAADELVQDPVIAADVWSTLASAYESLGLYAQSEQLYRAALQVPAAERRGAGQAGALIGLAWLLVQRGNSAGAQALCHEALAILRCCEGEHAVEEANALNILGCALHSLGDWPAAARVFEDALQRRCALLAEDDPAIGQSLNNLAAVLKKLGRLEHAEPLYRQALRIARQRGGDDHLETATHLSNLASMLKARADYAAARTLYHAAIDVFTRRLGDDHVTVATVANNLGNLYERTGHHQAAERLLHHALGLRRDRLGPGHPHVGTSLNNLATALEHSGRYAEAESLYREALAVHRRRNDSHPEISAALSNLAQLLHRRGALSAAAWRLREALALHRSAVGPDHVHVARMLNSLGDLLLELGESTAAEGLQRESLDILRRRAGPQHHLFAGALMSLAQAEHALGRFGPAERRLRQAHDILERSVGRDHPDALACRCSLANLLAATGRRQAAEPLLREALRTQHAEHGRAHPAVLQTLHETGVMLAHAGEFAEAESCFRGALEAAGVMIPARSACWLADTLAAQDRIDEARGLAQECAERREAAFGGDHPLTRAARAQLRAMDRRTSERAAAKNP